MTTLRGGFSPKAWIQALMEKHRLWAPKRPAIYGMLPAKVEEARIGRTAEEYMKSDFRVEFEDFLELKASKLYDEFQQDGGMSKEVYFRLVGLLKDIGEFPVKRIEAGLKASLQLKEWDEQGLTQRVADADASTYGATND